ncbi:MAG: TraR/DksA C4-type zinc finger protein [Bacteroidetes bacterium]|nr:TraR/DksA C4-type zinc finger protein [Bacteroidota bacterium]
MSGLTTEEREQLREALISRRDETKQDIETLTEAVQPIAPDNAIGRLSRMDAISSKGVNEELLRQAKERLRLIERALQNIDHPRIGTCTRCGRHIPFGRLLIMPESTRCASCSV